MFESLPLTIVLPADAANVGVTLSGTSREVGQLEITGRLTALTSLSCTRLSGTPVHTEGYPKNNSIFAWKLQFCWLAGVPVRVYCN